MVYTSNCILEENGIIVLFGFDLGGLRSCSELSEESIRRLP